MTAEEWKAAEAIFHAACELPAASRASFLREKCGHEPALLAHVEALVEARERADQWTPPPSASAARPRRFGAYELEKMIGRGGMGAVYLAHRADGEFTQKAAIKIAGLPFEIEPLRERLKLERQILANLNHPNITHLLDGGVTEDGELYLTMEYVEGTPLDEYLRSHPLTVHSRLELFRKITGAVAYAHQNLVVHRDLKPSNILVTPDGEPKLLDFGTAKLLHGATAQATGTNSGFLTVAYASPEQLRGDVVTTLTDVYSLGAILYAMLTGQPAFPSEIAARLNGLSELHLPAAVPGELDLIVRKALDPEPARRYSSVQELGAEIDRYLGGHPVHARPASWAYHASKFVARNKATVAAALLVLTAAATGAGMTLWQARKAQARFDELRGFARFVMADLHKGLLQLPGSTALQRTAVERSLGYLDRLAAESAGDDSLKLEVAGGYLRLGDVAGNPYRANLGDRKQAEVLYRKGLAMAQSARRTNEARRLTAELEIQLAGAVGFGGSKDVGLAEIRHGAEEMRVLSQVSPGDAAMQLSASRAWEALGRRLTAGGGNIEEARAGEAEHAYRAAVGYAERALALQTSPEDALLQLAVCEMSLGLLTGSSKPGEAMEHQRRALGWLDKLPEGAARAAARRTRASVLGNLGWAEGQAGQYENAIAHQRESAALLKALSDADPGNTNLLYAITGAHRALGIVEGYRKNHAAAAAQFGEAANIHARLMQLDASNQVYRFLRGENLVRAGNELTAAGRNTEAAAAAREGLEAIRTLASAPNAAPTHLFGGCRWFTDTAVAALRDGRAAEGFCRKALAATGGKDLDAYAGLVGALKLAGDRAGALRELKHAIALLPPTPSGHPVSRQRMELETELKSLSRGPR